MSGPELIYSKESDIQEAKEGSRGKLKLLEVQTNGIIPSRMRHVIKRYLKKAGFTNLKVEHKMGPNPFAMVLTATGEAKYPVSKEQESKLNYLRESVIYVLNQSKNGYPVHASQADPELLRKKLSVIEPSLNKIYYSVRASD